MENRSILADIISVEKDDRFKEFAANIDALFNAYRGQTWPNFIADLFNPIVSEILSLPEGHYTRQIGIRVLCNHDLN